MKGKYTIRSIEEKLDIVKQVLDGKSQRAWEPEIRRSVVADWVKKYLAEGEAGLEPKKRAGNPLQRFERGEESSYEEKLLRQIELLKRELLVKEAEVLRLKRRNERKEGDARRK